MAIVFLNATLSLTILPFCVPSHRLAGVVRCLSDYAADRRQL